MFERLGHRLRAYAEKDGRGYPDWALRYLPIMRRLRKQDLTGKCIVEIGANAAGFARFARVRTIAVDRELQSLREARACRFILPVAADGTALPFRDHGVDVCLCVDTIEHLPRAVRQSAVAQIVRVLRGTGVGAIAFPSGEGAARAEQRIRQEYHHRTGRTLPWLEEHAALGLPDAAEVARWLLEADHGGRRVSVARNCSLSVWRWVWQVLICEWPGRGNAIAQAVLRLATPLLARLHVGQCYRAMIWIEPGEQPGDTGGG